jgi:hypothetical protein
MQSKNTLKKPETEVIKIRIRRDVMAKIRENAEITDRTYTYVINLILKEYHKIQ